MTAVILRYFVDGVGTKEMIVYQEKGLTRITNSNIIPEGNYYASVDELITIGRRRLTKDYEGHRIQFRKAKL